MANAKKCDRCGVLYEKYDGIKFDEQGWDYNCISLQADWRSYGKGFDLCPKCMEKLIVWLKEADNNT